MHIPDIMMALLFLIPLIALTGGIIVGIVKAVGQQRQIELAQRERIAAIERGIDPKSLPPILAAGASDDLFSGSPQERARRQSQGLMIGGILTLAIGIGITVLFSITEQDGNSWAIGILPVCIAIGLLVSAWLVRPRANGHGTPPRAN